MKIGARGGFTVPAHYGHLNQKWPPGEYWLVELVRNPAPTLFWCDAPDAASRTGWGYLPQSAAGFQTEQDARSAFAQRGALPVETGTVEYRLHIWD